MNLKYVNSKSQEVSLLGSEFRLLSDASFHNYSWTPSTLSRRNGVSVKKFKKAASSYSVKALTVGSDPKAALNNLFEAVEYDVTVNSPGKLYWGDYYINCFVTDKKVVPKTGLLNRAEVSLTIYCPVPFWIKRTVNPFRIGSASEGLDFPCDFPFDFTPDINVSSIVNQSYAPCDMEIIIYGPATNPSVIIGGHEYKASCTVESGQYLDINTMDKTIELVNIDRSTVNEFSARNTESYIFEQLPTGANSVTWDNTFNWDAIVIEQRSEPKWT